MKCIIWCIHPCTGAAGSWGQLDRVALEQCVCAVALALAAVMAGTGHLPTLRLLRGDKMT